MTEQTKLTIGWLSWGAILLFVTVDRGIKFYVAQHPDVVRNTGIAFDIPLPPSLLYAAVVLILVALTRQLVTAVHKGRCGEASAIGAIIAGGVSNFYDRLFFGGVIDYITLVGWFPTFNLADVLITLGVIGVGLSLLYESRKKDH